MATEPVIITATGLTKPGADGSWEDIDISSHVPSGATGALIHVLKNNTTDLKFGVRKKGSTDDFTGTLAIQSDANMTVLVGLDANRVFQAICSNWSVIDEIKLIGYYTEASTFLTSWPSLDAPAALDTWYDRDLSSIFGTDTPQAVHLFIGNGGATTRAASARPDGSSNIAWQPSRQYSWCSVGCPGNIIEILASLSLADYVARVIGWSNDGHDMYEAEVDVTPSSNTTWTEDAIGAGSAAGIYRISHASTNVARVNFRPAGGTALGESGNRQNGFLVCPANAEGKVELWKANTDVTIFRAGRIVESAVTTETEIVLPNARLASTNLQDSASNNPPTLISDLTGDPEEPDANWWTAVDATLATDARLGLATPVGTLSGTQTLQALLRKTAGTPNPSEAIALWENGTLVRTLLASTAITSTTGQIVEATFATSELTNPANAEIRLVSTVGSSAPLGGFLRPDGTVDAGTWTIVEADTLHQAIAGTTSNDASYAQSANNPADDIFTVSLSDVTDPGVDTGHIVRWRGGKTAAAGRQIDLTMDLMQGATVIASQTQTNVTETPTTWTLNVSEAQAGNITDYNDLRFRVTANSQGGGAGRSGRIYWAELETPLTAGSAVNTVEIGAVRWLARVEESTGPAGAGAATLGGLSATSEGTHATPAFDGAGSATLGALSSAAAGSHAAPLFAGDAAAALAALSASGDGTVAFHYAGAGAAALAALSAAAAATHATPLFAGDAAAMLGAMLSQGAGAQAFAFSGDAAAILRALVATGTATFVVQHTADGAATLSALSASGEATWTTVFNGDGAAQLAALVAAAEATHAGPTFAASSEALLAGLLVSAAGTHAAPTFAAAGAATLSPLAAAAAGSFAATFSADGEALLAALAAAGAGSHAGPTFPGDGVATLAALIAAAEASHTAPQFTATAETALAALQTLAAGGHSILTFSAAGEVTLGALVGGGTAEWSEFATGAAGGRRGGLWPWGLRMGGG